MPKVIDHDQRRREIVEVAKRLIAAGGFEAATMRSIVTAAGFANGALKHYFASKDCIIAATFESVLQETEQRVSTLDPSVGPVEALRGFVEAAMPLDEHRITSARVLLVLWEHSVANPELARQYRELLTAWRLELIRRISAACGSALPAAAVEVLADEVISVTIGANVASLMHPVGDLVPRYSSYVDGIVHRIAG
ncbi:TetR/AcrR family transcriptional regulator [Actinokineospora globicatena]|uniref:Transcriptional regulator n=1 Tax=Actinokineospora globicatena TaxID=103729 RepID=A0A9W6QRC2_9PSEU|nr:TetR/AcrR family transcriptional regulator [Actinokineospora globicatena]MCP2305981.1 transcriptional regulator, TetR family [Actinokineospora globicatena]GLW80148.1 transcriptional regulator [Actinokineospora globicatena]GLW86977.1 transcriptional regulator [Actinokineospora globicatena]GLW93343.1 transcriptional regulator [Actinokineospora globicatena]